MTSWSCSGGCLAVMQFAKAPKQVFGSKLAKPCLTPKQGRLNTWLQLKSLDLLTSESELDK